jgi:hypothetical protein
MAADSTEPLVLSVPSAEPKRERMFREAAVNDGDFRQALYNFKGTVEDADPNSPWGKMQQLLIDNNVFTDKNDALLKQCLVYMATIDWQAIHGMEKKLSRPEDSVYEDGTLNPFSA